MACRDCDEKAKLPAIGFGAQVFTCPLPDLAHVELVVRGSLSPLAHKILKEWLGMVYDTLAPEETTDART